MESVGKALPEFSAITPLAADLCQEWTMSSGTRPEVTSPRDKNSSRALLIFTMLTRGNLSKISSKKRYMSLQHNKISYLNQYLSLSTGRICDEKKLTMLQDDAVRRGDVILWNS